MPHFDDLWRKIAQMGSSLAIEDIDFTFETTKVPDLIHKLADGIEIDIGELDSPNDHGGLLGYQGAQVLLFIQDQERNFQSLSSGQYNLPKFHLADCSTLRAMRNQGRFERYVVTNDTSGIFRLNGPEGRSMDAELSVCKNCLNYLNYEGYKTSSHSRSRIFQAFNLDTFFATYSSLFSVLPERSEHNSFNISSKLMADEQGNATCSNCYVELPVDRALLGHVVGETDPENTVCLDCQRKTNLENSLPVPRAAMHEIAAARRKKRPLTNAMTWDEVYQYADSAFTGLLRVYQNQGWAVPEPGVEIVDEKGSVCLQLGLAWFYEDGSEGEAVVLDEAESAIAKKRGWKTMTLNEALLDSMQDG